jgi:uncharacterized membrane protein
MVAQDENTTRTRRSRLIGILPADRLTAFADGVFAIAITLLVLELPVPQVTEDLLSALFKEWPSFLAYIISFVFIGGFWIAHSAITRLTEREDGVTFRLTLVMLFFISLMPFSTKLMATHLNGPTANISVLIYGLDLLITSFMLERIMHYLTRRPELLVDSQAEEELRVMTRQRRRFGIVMGLIGVLLALVLPAVAVAIYTFVAVYFILRPLFIERSVRHVLKKEGQ